VDPVVVATQQLIERETIAALCGGDQGGVVELARNATSVTNGSETPRDVRIANSLTNDTLTEWGGGVADSDTLVQVAPADT
jgi:hypothetical protein